MKYNKLLVVFVATVLVVSVFGAFFGSIGSADQTLANDPTVEAELFAGGSGTENDPYMIENVTELQNMNQNLSAHYELANDIDASETEGWNSSSGFGPVGNNTHPFTGELDGKGFDIQSLYIDRADEDYVGLFGAIDGASVSNVSLTDVDVSGYEYVGGLVGVSLQNSMVIETGVSGNVSGDNDIVGGLIGENYDTVERSYAMVHVNPSGSNNDNIGGLIGSSGGFINSSFATGDVEGDTFTGGLIGSYGGATVNNSFSTGNVNGGNGTGGLMGSITDSSLVKNSYAAGNINGGDVLVGGLIGNNDGSTVDSFSLETPVIGGGQGTQQGRVTDADKSEMKDYPLYTQISYSGFGDLNESWDFVGDPQNDTADKDIWNIDQNGVTNDGYPFLDWAGHNLTINIEGNGTVEVDGQGVSDGWNSTILGNKEVELQAVPDANNEFVNWTGDYTSEEEIITINMDSNKSITANFYEPPAYYNLTVDKNGNGSIDVNGKSVETPFTAEYPEGENVEIVATPDDCHEFINWTGNHTSTNEEITIKMDGNKWQTANFQEVQVVYDITDWDDLCTMRCDLDGDYTLQNDLNESTQGYNNTHIVTDEVEEKFGPSSAGNEYLLHHTPVQEILYAEDLGTGSEVNVDLIDGQEGRIKLNEGTEGQLRIEYRISEPVFMGWEPVGDEENRFTGSFDGQGHNITGLNISRPHAEKVGLFGHIDHGSVSNISLVDVNVTGKHEVGGLVGRINGTITNVDVTGEVVGHKVVGGLAAVSGLYPIEDSYTSVDVHGVVKVGGVVGLNIVGAVNNTYATGYVSGINESFWYASEIDGVVGGKDVGGLVGMNFGNVTNSYATGNVSGTGPAGGLVGTNVYRIENSYATGDVSGNVTLGGLVGACGGTVKDSYSNGTVSGNKSLGGLIGMNTGGTIINSHYNIDNVLINGGNHVTIGGLFDAQYQDWITNKNLSISNYSSTLEPSGNYYNVSTVQGLRDLLGFSWDAEKMFQLAGDINLSSAPGLYIPYLETGFEGNGYNISNLELNLPFVSQLGFIGYVGHKKSGMFEGWYHNVSNFNIVDANVTGGTHVGGLLGHSIDGAVLNSSVTGNITGNFSVGGLVGKNDNGAVENSSADEIEVIGNTSVGGLVGWNRHKVIDSYSTGTVGIGEGADQDTAVGGLVGFNGLPSGENDIPRIENSYSTANVSGYGSVGGLAGMNQNVIIDSYATGNVSGGDAVGGLVGGNGGPVSYSYATGNVSGNNSLGGLVGQCFESTIKNSYATGNVTGEIADSSGIGGLVGTSQESSVQKSYATGNVSGNKGIGGLIGMIYNTTVSKSYSIGSVEGSQNVGGLIGFSFNSSAENSFWDTDTSGMTTSAEGTGKTTAEMKNVTTFTDTSTEGLSSAWDFVANPYDDENNNDIWHIDDNEQINDGYPFLTWEDVNLTLYELTLGTKGEGSIVPAEGTYTYEEEDVVTIEATPADNWEFVEWTGDVTGTNPTKDVTMDGDKSVTAVFEMVEYNLTINTDGQGSTSPSEGTHTYQEGSVVTVEATPADGWEFVEWTGDATGTSSTIDVTMNSDKSVTSVFQEIPEYDLTISTDGEGSTSPSEGNHTYQEGSTVTVEATPANGWEFVEWTGDATGTSSTIDVTMDSAKSVTAVFEMVEYNLTINTDGQGSTSPSEGTHTYEEGMVVTVEATPADGWEFVEWTGDATGTTASIDITMDADKSITAVFEEELEKYDLTINTDGEGSTSPSEGTHTYDEGTVVTVEATPADGWEFVEWTGDATGTNPTIDITMNANKSITAGFDMIEYDLTINIDGEGSTSPSEGTHTYEEGMVVTVEATPADGWEFVEWTGDVTGTDTTIDITMNGNKEITANFEEKPKAEFEVTNFNVNVDGLQVTITGTVENIGDAEGTVRLTVDGEEIASFTLQPGETQDVEETHEFDQEGTYTIEFGDQSETVSLEETGEDDTPGFTTMLLLISSVIAVAIYYKKKR